MPITIVVGTQWGDEGKGRVIDFLAAEADMVARYSGGDNAGHTVTVGNQIFKLHLVPSGIVRPNTVSVMGAGMVDPAVLDSVGYDSERYTGFAFGMGPARIAALKYGIRDIRVFFENDIRFLSQFAQP